MPTRKRGLGRGLDALLGSEPEAAKSGEGKYRELPIEWIRPGKFQPRTTLDVQSLEDLAKSIRSQGLMQPIVVRKIQPEHYEIIAGERRWRACQMAGMDKVSAAVREVEDESVLAMSLIENIQREDLNPLEEAYALQRLMEDFRLTHQEVADAVGKSRTAVTNSLRLTQLNEEVKAILSAGRLEMGHARAMLGLPHEQQRQVAAEVLAKALNVRQTEALVRRVLSGQGRQRRRPDDPDTRGLEERLSAKLGQPVSIQHGARGKGKLVIRYSSLDELDGLLSRFGSLEEGSPD